MAALIIRLGATDSNGRIGRALINAIFRRRAITSNLVVPLASGLSARREEFGNTTRKGSAALTIINNMVETPYFTADEVSATFHASPAAVYEAIEKLRQLNIVKPLTQRKRDQIGE